MEYKFKQLSDLTDRSMEDAIPNTHIRLVLKTLGPDSPQYQYLIRVALAIHLTDTLGYLIHRALIKQDVPTSADRPQLERFIFALELISRGAGMSGLAEPRGQMAWVARFDRLTPKVSGGLARGYRIWIEQAIELRGRRYRQRREQQHRLEREERLKRRRQQREVQAVQPAQPKKKKQAEHEEVEYCSKCGKRRVVRDHLCEQCLSWERAKLGRS